ncbi:hypothetical protein BDZ89DRAFT_1060165 [Hymenopellis radicata]|nr:hypothetical protein BDZ89DRAFT_1060165 [Hymenopellis radicata]
MNHRIGAESTVGVGGGGISEESLKNLEIGTELCRRRQPNEALPYLYAAYLDERNVDACIQLAWIQPNPEECLEMLQQGGIRAKKVLKEKFGPKALDDDGPCVGQFWHIVETRPYMRVLQNRAKMALQFKRPQQSADAIIEMLRLSPDDRLNQHTWLGSILCRLGRYSDALYFIQVYFVIYTTKGDECPVPERGGTIFRAPYRTVYPPEREKELEYPTCFLTYTAALASFNLWGDCEESRQYLRIAARGNPHVMVKLLAKIKQPENMNNEARPYNGREDAHDYLWLAQDMWMKPDIWEWVNSQPEAHQVTLKPCGNASCDRRESGTAEFQQCSSCHQIWYCSVTCQRADWKSHKSECQARKLQQQAKKAFAAGQPLPEKAKMPIFAADITSEGIHLYDGLKATATEIPEGIPKPKKKKKKSKKTSSL